MLSIAYCSIFFQPFPFSYLMIACTAVIDSHDEISVFLRWLLRVMLLHFRPNVTILAYSILDLSLVEHE